MRDALTDIVLVRCVFVFAAEKVAGKFVRKVII